MIDDEYRMTDKTKGRWKIKDMTNDRRKTAGVDPCVCPGFRKI
jgi:hypothetical protein